MNNFYEQHSRRIVMGLLLSFPIFWWIADNIPSNNDIETWMPGESQVRETYEEFKREFGAEEVVLVALSNQKVDSPLVESLRVRIARLPEISECYSPAQMQSLMTEFGVREEEQLERLKGLTLSDSQHLQGLVAVLNESGLKNRKQTVQSIRDEIEYCQLEQKNVLLAGTAVVVTELDELGSSENNAQYFLVTLVLSWGLLYYLFKDAKLTLSLLGLTVWAIQFSMTLIYFVYGEVNFILNALPVMVMVFTLAIIIHFVHYFDSVADQEAPFSKALKLAWKPCSLATLTTVIGLVSLSLSEMMPVRQFGIGAALGCGVALLTGLLATPAILVQLSYQPHVAETEAGWFTRLAHGITRNSRLVSCSTGVVVFGLSLGLWQLHSHINALDFLPKESRVRNDVRRIEKELTHGNSIEGIVEFPDEELAFVEKLNRVREMEKQIRTHESVRHTMSLGIFFPKKLPEGTFELLSLLDSARGKGEGDSGYVSSGETLWRISIRTNPHSGQAFHETQQELQKLMAGQPITFTGSAALIEQAQAAIYTGFWESFMTAFVIITIVMIISLRSLSAGLVAMVPNLTPICIVFGAMGWMGVPLDIGIMMTGSIALGLAVDGTFHFLVRYQEHQKVTGNNVESSRLALLQTGSPIFQAAVIAGVSMLALMLSPFGPTAKFGLLMSLLLLAAVIGDLVLLPALLAFRGGSEIQRKGEPAHFLDKKRQSAA